MRSLELVALEDTILAMVVRHLNQSFRAFTNLVRLIKLLQGCSVILPGTLVIIFLGRSFNVLPKMLKEHRRSR